MTDARARWGGRIAEGFVIVVSILLAFALDAGWDGYQERKEIAELLALLDEELALNRTGLEDAIEAHRRIGAASDSAGDAGNFRRWTEQAVFAVERFAPQSSALRTLEQSGLLREIDDPRFRQLVVAWPTRTLEYGEAEARSAGRRELLRSRIAEIGDLRPGRQIPADSPLWTDRQVINLIMLRATDSRDAIEAGERFLEYLERLQGEILALRGAR